MEPDEVVFAALFDAHYRAVCRYLAARVPRDAVEDVAAETFLVAWRRLDELPAQPVGWLLRTAAMCSRNQRRTLVRSAALAERLGELAPELAHLDDQLIQSTQRRALLCALAGLSERDREVVLLRHWDGLAPREIAVALGTTAIAARTRLHRGQRRLQRALEEALGVDGLHPSRTEPTCTSTTPSAS